ncbi:myosin heavy chain 95F-like [Agrilus planipennis]|nr:myosin heavy chain 95F-like [Agrilus planipennis]XP_025829674.1 myosin heavy chain 95F-like [Agrilus planipennis]
MKENNKKSVAKDINNLKEEIKKAISKIKGESKLSENTIDDLYNQLASKINKYINELKKSVTQENENLKELEQSMKQEIKLNEKEERRKRTEQINRTINLNSIRRKKQEQLERKKQDELDKQRLSELQAEIVKLAEEEQRLRELLELERQDHEVALRLAVESNGKVDESSQIGPRLEAVKRQKRAAIYGNAKLDLSKWKYFELRNILVSSPADEELLEACKYEFHRRLKIYHEWRLKNKGTASASLNDDIERIPQAIAKRKPKPLNLDNHDNKARYFRVAIRKSGSKDPRERGWWYAHFQGQYVARQLHLLPNKRPVLLVAGKDDLQMCELSLEESGLLKKRNAAISENEFETQWEQYGGKPYISI